MKISEIIAEKVKRMSEGSPFGYADLGLDRPQYAAAAKALERQVAEGSLRRYAKGRFFKPRKTLFGEVGLSEKEILRSRLYIQGKQVGYVTGPALYREMGLTTQVPSVIQIASHNARIEFQYGQLRAKAVRSYVDVATSEVPLLELLDAMKDFNKIPDLDRAQGIAVLSARIKALKQEELEKMSRYAESYPARAGALLGALLDYVGKTDIARRVMGLLNPLTKYRLGLKPDELPTAPDWNIL